MRYWRPCVRSRTTSILPKNTLCGLCGYGWLVGKPVKILFVLLTWVRHPKCTAADVERHLGKIGELGIVQVITAPPLSQSRCWHILIIISVCNVTVTTMTMLYLAWEAKVKNNQQFVHILPSTLVALSWIPKSSSPTVSKLTTPISSSNCLFFPHRTFSLELTHPTRNLILQCSALLTVEPTKFPCLSQFICWVSEMQQMKEQVMYLPFWNFLYFH